VDTSFGGNGNDDLWALARGDVTSPGDTTGDTLVGGKGKDKFHTFDGEVDKVTCGPGKDRAILDQFDVITDATSTNMNGSCETVTRTTVENEATEKKYEAPSSDRKEG
jgi:hypothetical protein